MSDLDPGEHLVRENEALRRQSEHLLLRAVEAEQALSALANGEIDAVALQGSSTPVLLRAAQEDLRNSRQLLRAIFDGAQDAMLLADDAGTYVEANPAACALFGTPHEELIGSTIAEFTAPGYDGRDAYRTFRETGTMRGQFPLQRRDGGQRILDFSAVANVAPGLHLSVLRDVTEHAAAESALRRSEALFRAVIEKSAEIVSLTTADGVSRYLTPWAWQKLGWAPEEVGAGTMREQVIPEDRARIASELERLVRTGSRDMLIEFRVQHRDGSILWIESSATNLLEDPNVGAIVGHYRDVTERKQAEQQLRESRNLLENAQAAAHVGSWVSAIDEGATVSWTSECCRIFGLPVGTTVTLASLFALVHPADREALHRASRVMLEGGAPIDTEHRVLKPDGRPCWVHARAFVEREAGRAPRLVGTVQDVTERRFALEALEASEARYRRIVENTSEGVCVYDADGVTTFMNARLAEMLGFTVEEAVGQPIYNFMSEAVRPEARARVARRQHGLAERLELVFQRKDGTSVPTSYQANPIFDADGRFEGAVVLVTDVTASRRADETRARLAAIVECSDDAILSTSLDGTITSWNRGAERLYQYRAEEVVDRSIFDLVPAEARESERGALDRVAHGEAVETYETVRLRKDGSRVEVAVTLSPIYDAERNLSGVSRVCRDLTPRRRTEVALRRAEDQLRQAQKMEAVGRLAGGVAHDFNNLLSVILSYTSLALDQLTPGDPLRQDMSEIEAAGKRATELTRQLLAFSRQQVLQAQVIDLNRLLAGMASMLRRLLGEDIELTILAAPSLGSIIADPGQIEQVVMNLAVNARDAMPQGGKLTIELANFELGADYVGAHLGVSPGDYVMLAMSDTGTGMDEATRTRIFEPFFTTKEQGKGTGLGLSTVFGIVEQSGGYIGVYSEPGHGCTFKVYLPQTARVAEVAVATIKRGRAAPGSETILLVEDEEQLRVVASTILRRNGYNVLDASNGGEALLIARDFPAKIHLLLTDVVMPRMSGRRLVEELAPLRPDMKILFASGYTDDAIVRHGVLDAGVAFLQKPFTPDALLRKVRDVLESVDRR